MSKDDLIFGVILLLVMAFFCMLGVTIGTENMRKQAIEKAIVNMQPQDALLIAGKGHEKFQIIGDKKHPHDDIKIVKNKISST